VANARETLFLNVGVIESLIQEEFSVDDAVGVSEHNRKATVIRNGLAVSLFNALEHFLRERYSELLSKLSATKLTYSDFPESLKQFLTVRAVGGLNGHLTRLERSERLSAFETHIEQLGGATLAPPRFSPLAFGYERSNINQSDISASLSAFGARHAWRLMASVCTRAGLNRLDLGTDFDNLSKMRNRAAHNASASIDSSSLTSAVDIVRGIAFGFDVICGRTIDIYCEERIWADVERLVVNPEVKFRFLDQVAPGLLKERSENSKRYRKVYRQFELAKTEALALAIKYRQILVIRSSGGLLREWHN
jgi:hypothetical protein